MGIETDPDLIMVLRAALSRRLRSVHTQLPAKIVDYDSTKQLATCQPMIQAEVRQEDGSDAIVTLPPVHNVPVIFPGAGGFRVTFPVQPGDVMLLIFSEASIDAWLSSDGNTIIDPKDYHRHNLSDGMAIPGLHPINLPWKVCPNDHMTAGQDAGMLVHFRGTTIGVGGESDFVALAAKVLTELGKLQAAVNAGFGVHNTHSHAVAVVPATGIGATTSVIGTAVAAPAPSSVASTALQSD